MRFGRELHVLLVLLLVVCTLGARRQSVRETSHNLSVTGPGEIRALNETRVCIFCHTSHQASTEGPLWNHRTDSPMMFKIYDRETLEGKADQPNGATKLCLSCHDGTIAVGSVHSSERIIEMQNVGGGGEIPRGRKGHIGTDLSGTHPVSIRMSQETTLQKTNMRWPPSDSAREVGLDSAGYVQCTSCHDPHGSRSEHLPFWQKESFAEVCKVCHEY